MMIKATTTALLALLLPAVAFAQTNTQPQPTQTQPQTATDNNQATQGEDQSPASLFPPTNRPWTPADYQKAVTLVVSKRAPLPSLEDKNTKAVFLKLVDPANLPPLTADGKNVRQRLALLQGFITPLQKVLLRYVSGVLIGKNYEREVSMLHVFYLNYAARAYEISNQMQNQTVKDKFYVRRLLGIHTMKQGLRTIVIGYLTTLSDQKLLSGESQVEMAEALTKLMPAFKGLFTQKENGLFASIAAELAVTAKTEPAKAALKGLAAAFKAA